MSSFKNKDLLENLPPRDLERLNVVIGKMQERNYSLRKPMVMKAAIRLFLMRYVKLNFGKHQAPEWVCEVDDAIREILEISKDE